MRDTVLCKTVGHLQILVAPASGFFLIENTDDDKSMPDKTTGFTTLEQAVDYAKKFLAEEAKAALPTYEIPAWAVYHEVRRGVRTFGVKAVLWTGIRRNNGSSRLVDATTKKVWTQAEGIDALCASAAHAEALAEAYRARDRAANAIIALQAAPVPQCYAWALKSVTAAAPRIEREADTLQRNLQFAHTRWQNRVNEGNA